MEKPLSMVFSPWRGALFSQHEGIDCCQNYRIRLVGKVIRIDCQRVAGNGFAPQIFCAFFEIVITIQRGTQVYRMPVFVLHPMALSLVKYIGVSAKNKGQDFVVIFVCKAVQLFQLGSMKI